MVSWGEIPARIEVSSRNDKSIFVGVARASDADAFLAGVARDEVSSFDHDRDHDMVHLRGAYQAPSPLDTDIWVASTVDGVLEWDIRDGDWAIVALRSPNHSPIGSSGCRVNTIMDRPAKRMGERVAAAGCAMMLLPTDRASLC